MKIQKVCTHPCDLVYQYININIFFLLIHSFQTWLKCLLIYFSFAPLHLQGLFVFYSKQVPSSAICWQNLKFCSLPASFQAVSKYFLTYRLFKGVPQQQIDFPLRVNALLLRILPPMFRGHFILETVFCQKLLNETPWRFEFNTN